MLKSRYDEILVGMNLMSMIRGIISLKREKTVLLINDLRFLSDNYHLNFLSELEISGLIRLGKAYDIPELMNIRHFIRPAELGFLSDRFFLQLARSPFENLKEFLRKFPAVIDKDDLDVVFGQNEDEFNVYFLKELKRYEAFAFDSRLKTKNNIFTLQGPSWFLNIFKSFSRLINQDFSDSKDLKFSILLHLLGISFEEKMKTFLAEEEIAFYFFRMLSPTYRLEDFFLLNQLKRRFLKLSGDYKESQIQYWQLVENKFENLLLASFEGVISGHRVLFFSHLPVEVPFSINSPFSFYRKARLAPLSKKIASYRAQKLSLLCNELLLGTERPFRVFLYDKQLQSFELPYLDLPGTKPEFYYPQLFKSYEDDSKRIVSEYIEVDVSAAQSVTLDMRSLKKSPKYSSSILTPIPIEITQEEKNIAGFEYWGALKFKSLGLLSMCYGVEGN